MMIFSIIVDVPTKVHSLFENFAQQFQNNTQLLVAITYGLKICYRPIV